MRTRLGALGLALSLGLIPVEGQDEKPAFPPEQIEQLVAPIALHPDDLISQILMASTYPLEVVQAQRWLKANPSLKGDAQAKALEKKDWDPSVKSLINFPDVIAMMDGKIDWTQNLGNAFLAQKKDVMDAIQRLRKKAIEAGNLKDSKEMNVEEGDPVVISSTDPEVIYVPVYNPTVVYGSWGYPAYPPYYYYPPYYRPTPTPYAFAAGVTLGLAWGYAWGNCNWGHCDVDVDIDRNVNRNRNINRDQYRNQMQNRGMTGGKGAWQHDASHRRGAGYGDKATAQRYGRGTSPTAGSREAYRGRTDAGASRARTTPAAKSTGQKPSTRQSTARSSQSQAFGGYSNGSRARAESSRGQASRQSYNRSSGSRGGGSRGGGGGRGGGGRR